MSAAPPPFEHLNFNHQVERDARLPEILISSSKEQKHVGVSYIHAHNTLKNFPLVLDPWG